MQSLLLTCQTKAMVCAVGIDRPGENHEMLVGDATITVSKSELENALHFDTSSAIQHRGTICGSDKFRH